MRGDPGDPGTAADPRRLCARATRGEPLTQSETARLLGVTRQSVLAAERRALVRLGEAWGALPRKIRRQTSGGCADTDAQHETMRGDDTAHHQASSGVC